MGALVSYEYPSDTLTLCEKSDGWWLYDTTRGMNLAMRADSRDAAFVAAITYYQTRLQTVETDHRALTAKVDAFVSQFNDDDQEEF